MDKQHSIDQALIELSKTKGELLASLDDIDIGLPNFLSMNEKDPSVLRKMKIVAIWTKYQEKICKDDTVVSIFSDSKAESKAMLVCGIADLLSFNGAMSVAALFVKEGIHLLCAPYWGKRS